MRVCTVIIVVTTELFLDFSFLEEDGALLDELIDVFFAVVAQSGVEVVLSALPVDAIIHWG